MFMSDHTAQLVTVGLSDEINNSFPMVSGELAGKNCITFYKCNEENFTNIFFWKHVWKPVLIERNVNKKYKSSLETFQHYYILHSPLIGKININSRKNIKGDWVTDEIKHIKALLVIVVGRINAEGKVDKTLISKSRENM